MEFYPADTKPIRAPHQSFGRELPVLEFFCIRSCTCFSFCSSNLSCCSASLGEIFGFGCCFCSSFFFSCFFGGFFFFSSKSAFCKFSLASLSLGSRRKVSL